MTVRTPMQSHKASSFQKRFEYSFPVTSVRKQYTVKKFRKFHFLHFDVLAKCFNGSCYFIGIQLSPISHAEYLAVARQHAR